MFSFFLDLKRRLFGSRGAPSQPQTKAVWRRHQPDPNEPDTYEEFRRGFIEVHLKDGSSRLIPTKQKADLPTQD